ncbi:sulfite exporter TauE/SafE family protein [Bacillus solimangrovi]|uniref:Probable membrane transporter protein n=1 Tax=Bacillus solimangrovi TaxID=1305675 RepID=A0A1E5LEA9_9BACI|nr:sulfite exporter TauE/SafE family protein [Bacillus solimangrovi]OEH92384.1 integrase [Bacillus solimangrovi]
MTYLIILLAGIIAGFLNVVAGGGSLITMPMLIFLGLPSAMANGTNRIALMAQNIVAIASFRKSGYFDWRLSTMLAIPAVIGSIVGANAAIQLSDELFNKILSVVMVIVLILIIWNPTSKLTEQASASKKHRLLMIISFFFVGFYGGFIQAGVGFIIIATLTLISGMSLIKINSIKVFVVAVYMLSSLIIFIINGQVAWGYGLTLAVGTSIGALLGSKFAVSKGEKWIRLILIIVVTVMSIRLWFFS